MPVTKLFNKTLTSILTIIPGQKYVVGDSMYELLNRLVSASMPAVVRDGEAEMVQSYKAAGLVEAVIHPTVYSREGAPVNLYAEVTAVTRAGRLTVEKRRAHRTDKAFRRKM